MEIELVSQKGSEASRYTKFLDDEIVIPANSSIQLNHVVLEKTEGANFSTNQTMNLVIENSDTYGGVGDLHGTSISISEGYHTYRSLRTKIKADFRTLLATVPNNKFSEPYLFSLGRIQNGDVKDVLGGFTRVGLYSGTSQANFTVAGISIANAWVDDDIVYSNAASNATANSFYLHPDAYFHETQIFSDAEKVNPGIPGCNFQPWDVGVSGPVTINKIIAKSTAEGVSTQMYFGFYGQQYSELDTVGSGSRTGNGSIVTVPSSHNLFNIPTMFYVCSIHDFNGVVFSDTYICKDTNYEDPRDWEDQKNPIAHLQLMTHVNLSTVFDGDSDLEVNLQSYVDCQDTSWQTNPKVYIRTVITDGNTDMVFDSKDNSRYFSHGFFNGLGYSTEDIKRSQKAFHPAFSTNILQYGINMQGACMEEPTTSIIRRYKLSATEELAKVLGIYQNTTDTSTSNYLYPNFLYSSILKEDNMFSFLFQDVFKTGSYVVRLNNLNIATYKTNKNKNQRGYKQSILGVIPTPFADLTMTTPLDQDNQSYLSSTYNFRYPHVKQLDNQEIVLNRFDVEITSLDDDTVAEDLDFSSINFTIIPGKK